MQCDSFFLRMVKEVNITREIKKKFCLLKRDKIAFTKSAEMCNRRELKSILKCFKLALKKLLTFN